MGGGAGPPGGGGGGGGPPGEQGRNGEQTETPPAGVRAATGLDGGKRGLYSIKDVVGVGVFVWSGRCPDPLGPWAPDPVTSFSRVSAIDRHAA